MNATKVADKMRGDVAAAEYKQVALGLNYVANRANVLPERHDVLKRPLRADRLGHDQRAAVDQIA